MAMNGMVSQWARAAQHTRRASLGGLLGLGVFLMAITPMAAVGQYWPAAGMPDGYGPMPGPQPAASPWFATPSSVYAPVMPGYGGFSPNAGVSRVGHIHTAANETTYQYAVYLPGFEAEAIDVEARPGALAINAKQTASEYSTPTHTRMNPWGTGWMMQRDVIVNEHDRRVQRTVALPPDARPQELARRMEGAWLVVEIPRLRRGQAAAPSESSSEARP